MSYIKSLKGKFEIGIQHAYFHRFIEKYIHFIWLFVIFWSLAIMMTFVHFSITINKLDDKSLFKEINILIFIPLWVIDFFWIILFIFLLIKPKKLNNKWIIFVLIFLYSISFIQFLINSIWGVIFDAIRIPEYSTFFILLMVTFLVPFLTFFVRLTYFRFLPKHSLELNYNNLGFKIIKQDVLDIILINQQNHKKKKFSRFDYWMEDELISAEHSIKYNGSKNGLYFFVYNNNEFIIQTYRYLYIYLNKFDKETINEIIKDLIINSFSEDKE